MFAFSLDTGKETDMITFIDDVKNLESNSTNLGYRKVRLINVHRKEKLTDKIEKATKIYENQGFIHLLDKNNSIITSTFISNIEISKSDKSNLILSGYVWFKPKGFHKVCKMFINNELTEKNTWKKLDNDELQGWLVFALCTAKPQPDRENLIISIDGHHFHNLDGFYCTLGEEINGIGGYFGRQLHALYDCLRGNFGVKSISEIIWYHHQHSKKLLKTDFNKIIAVFEEFRISVILK